MATHVGDFLLDSKPYILAPGKSYVRSESIRTRPAPPSQPRNLSTFEHQDNLSYFGQSKFLGEGYPLWEGDGPYRDGYGLEPDPAGVMSVADALTLDLSDTANPDGWLGFRIGYSPGGPNEIVVFMGLTDGKSHVKDTVTGVWSVTTWPSPPVSRAFFSRLTLIGTQDGHVRRTDDGTMTTDLGVPDASVTGLDAHILGSLKGKLYVGYEDGSIWVMSADLTWDADPFLESGTLDMTPITGASGTNVLYILTEGPSPRILYTDGDNLYQANIISTDFNPHAAVFLGKLFMFGDQGFDVATKGACWVLSADGLSEDLSFGDGQTAQGISTAQVEGEVILWAATATKPHSVSGIGVWDPRLDQSLDRPLGFYVANTISSTAKASGIAASKGLRYVGIVGSGIYKTSTPGAYKVRMSQFGADQRNIQKRWVQAEVHHTALVSGQTVVVATTKDPDGTETSWGSSATVGDTSEVIPGPDDYRNPFLSLLVSGTANGSNLKLFDVALGYISVPDHDNTKREWFLKIAVSGHDQGGPSNDTRPEQQQRMRDGSENTRTSVEIKADLDLLWNEEVCFQDIDGNEYNVLVKSPSNDADEPSSGEIDRLVDDSGTIVNLSMEYTLHLIETTPHI